jgi:hypothetical protein
MKPCLGDLVLHQVLSFGEQRNRDVNLVGERSGRTEKRQRRPGWVVSGVGTNEQ